MNKQKGFLDDYAALIQAYIYLSAVKVNEVYLVKAKRLAERVINHFSDEEDIFFYFTKSDLQNITVRKEIYDGATPSGNALMVENLISAYFNERSMHERAGKMLTALKKMTENHPLSFGYLAINFQNYIKDLKEIVIVGSDFKTLLKAVLKEYSPLKIIKSSEKENNSWPLLRGKTFLTKLIYIFVRKLLLS